MVRQKKDIVFREIMDKVYRKKPWNRGVTAIAAVIVFITTYLLILPAITMTKDIVCGKEEHIHNDQCYETTYQRVLNCPYTQVGGGVIILHKHDANCYDAEGRLICPLQEIEEHVHTAACFGAEEQDLFGSATVYDGLGAADAFTSAEEGFGVYEGTDLFSSSMAAVPLCGKGELIPHVHTEECYDFYGNLICGKTEVFSHQHGEDCFSFVPDRRILICGREEHVHDDSCYASKGEELPEEVGAVEDFFTGEIAEDTAVIDDGIGAADDFAVDPEEMFGSEIAEENTDIIPEGNKNDEDNNSLTFFIGTGGEEAFELAAAGEDLFSSGESDDQEHGFDSGSDGGAALPAEIEGENVAEVPGKTENGNEFEESFGESTTAEETTELSVVETTTEITTETFVLVLDEDREAPAEKESENETAPGEDAEQGEGDDAGEEIAEADEVETTVEPITEITSEMATEYMISEQTTELHTEDTAIAQSAEETTVEPLNERTAEITTEEVSVEQSAQVTTEATMVEQSAEITTEWTAIESMTEQTTEGMTEWTTSETLTEQTTERMTEWTTFEQMAEQTTEDTTEWTTFEPASELTTERSTEWTTFEPSTEITTEWTTVETSTEQTTEWIQTTEYVEPTTAVLEYFGSDYKVRVTYLPASGIPAGAKVEAEEIAYDSDEYAEYLAQAKSALGLDESKELPKEYARFFDIQIMAAGEDGEWKEIEPTGPVRVEIIYDQPVNVEGADTAAANIVHFDEQEDETKVEVLATIDATSNGENSEEANHVADTEVNEAGNSQEGNNVGEAENGVTEDTETLVLPEANVAVETSIPGTTDEAEEEGTSEGKKTEDTKNTIAFEANSFSVYGVIYTVDFHWEVDGRMYEFSLPGGGFISLFELIEVLGVAKTGENEDVYLPGEVPGIDNQDISTEKGINNDIQVSERTREFVADVVSVVFSRPELVDVSKVENETTVGGIKESRGLEVQYSAELTEEQIAKINSTVVESEDWALISVQPFDTEETLTVTMKTGEAFEIRVTDYQISTNVLTKDGVSFKITVTFDDDAEIPEGTKLEAEEIEWGSEEYLQYLGRTWAEVNKEHSEKKDQSDDASMGNYVNVNAARFFDIKLIHGDDEIEPKAAVQVEITYVDGLVSWDGTKPGVVHFTKDNQVEILEKVETDIEDDTTVSFRYEQNSFSVIGTYIQQETRDAETPPLGVQSTSSRAVVSNRSTEKNDADISENLEDNSILAIPPIGLKAAGESESSYTEDDSGLPYPTGNKTLVPNDDGTYTLTLSVKGSSQTTIQKVQKKANVLFIMDRSSSMITNTVDDTEQFWYYGTQNTAEFRGDITPANGYQFYGEINGEIVELNATVLDWTQGGDGWHTFRFTYNGTKYDHDAPLYVRSKTTRLYAEQVAMDDVTSRLLAYNTTETPDEIEIAVISFADHRADTKGWTDTEYTSWVQGADNSSLMQAVNSTRYASGTNWEEALKYAYDVISSKKAAEEAADKLDEDYYVIFLTDGEPTNVEGDTSAAAHSGEGENGNIYAYDRAKDDAKKLVDEDYHFYNIFTYRIDEDETYSIYLTNYAYDKGDYNGTATEEVNTYFSDAQTVQALNDTFNNIFLTIADVIGHANVSITDTMTTDAMTTTVVQGKTNGYVYTVKDPSGTVLYTVTATGDISNPTVTFNVPASETKTYTATSSEEVPGLYSITTVEGQEYRIALADVNNTTGELEWDLSPVGILMNDCTYSVSFIVWPDQEAYDYVAGLNNGLPGYTWDTSSDNDTYQDLTDTKGYELGGVSRFPSIAKYPDGTFAVLTNTDQKVHYSVIEMETVNGEPNGDPTIKGPYYQDLETPPPMELTATETKLQKAWGIDRNPGTLAQMLYDEEGNPTEFKIKYGIKILDQQGTSSGSNESDDEEDPYYTTVTLGWDGTKYDWDTDSVRYVSLNGSSGPSVPVGTRWSKDFSIATGLMLSKERMDALGIDKAKYQPAYVYGRTEYYLLEKGHDYTIEEIIDPDAPHETYEFDFDAPTYHPMLVDGKLKSVTFNRDENDNSIISIKEISQEDWLVSLKVENNLRGYIKLEKDIVDKDGRTPLPDDPTEFEYRIDLYDPVHPGRFEGTHIPWYGVDDLFYHDDDFTYYQAETGTADHKAYSFTLTMMSEDGTKVEYPAHCTDPEGIFDEDLIGPTQITYNNGSQDITINLYGNQMEQDDENHVYAVMKINQDQVLDIANVPSKSTYSITETDQSGYNIVSIRKEIRNGDQVESGSTTRGTTTISGRIVPDRDNHIIYTNKPYSVDLTVKKTDENDMPLTGAVFSLYKKDGDDWSEEPVVTLPGEDEDDSAVYEFINLAEGSYKLVETPPVGYAAVDDVFFTVTDGVLSIDGTLLDGVTQDENKLLFTVKNTPRTDSLTVRKQWLDVNGNPRDYDGTLDLKINQWVQNVENQHTVTVTFRYWRYNNWTSAITRTGTGYGDATVNWSWNQNTNITNTSYINVYGGNATYESLGGNSYRLSIPNSDSDVQVYVDVNNNNSNSDPWTNYGYDAYSGVGSVQISGTAHVQEGKSLTGGKKGITLGTGSVWTQQFNVSGDGLLSDESTTLPLTYNGKNCFYTIDEESVPEGYELTQISSDPVQSGVLTAYNKRTSEDVDVTVKKVWVDGTNEDGTPTSHQDSLTVTLSNGQSVTLNDDNHWEATIKDLPKYDEEGNEIQYSWTEDELQNGYYLSDSNTVVYDGEVTTTLTNSYSEHYMPEMEIDGVKIWDDDGSESRPSSITVRLYKDNVLYKTTSVNPPTDPDANPDQWSYKFTNLPIFVADENGEATSTLAVYRVEEVLPAGYTSDYETVIQQTTATYVAGTATAHIINSYTAENQLVSEDADLGFVVVRHGQGYVVWTPRPLMEGELDKIKQAAVDASKQFKGIMSASGESLKTITGVPKTVSVGNKEAATVYMKDGNVWVRFEDPSAESDIVYGSIPYTYTQIGGEGGVTITNVRKTTSVSGTKTWVDGRQHNNLQEITLKLYRTTKPVTTDSLWEEVQLTATGTESFSWDGNTYTYSNLPRYDTNNPPAEYEYRVEETAVNVTEGTGADLHTISYNMEADGNNFINTELTNIEATKTWKDAGVSVNSSLINASVTFELQKKVGDNWIKVEQDDITNPQTLSVTETADPNAWKATWRNLPKYEKSGDSIVSIEYRVVETAATVDNTSVKPAINPTAPVSSDGKANINNTLPITINILKVDANDNTIKLGKAEFELTKVQAIDSTNQVTEGQYSESGTTSDANDDTKGTLQFTGITPGYYYLHEIKAPDGYVMTESNGWHFQVDENGIVQNVGDFADNGTFHYVDAKNITVENTPGAALPNTGGPGTRLFYLLGIMLTAVGCCGIVMMRKRRVRSR